MTDAETYPVHIPDLFDLSGRGALVTGASKGIGAAMAWALAAAGAHVMVTSRREEAVAAVADGIRKAGYKADAMALHMGEFGSYDAAVAQVIDRCGGLDILINNAAANPVFGPSLNTDAAAFDKIMDINVKGPFLLAKAAYPALAKHKRGSVINISSVGGITPEPGLGIYSVSKASLLSLTEVLAKEWGPAGVRVNAICPGLIKTKFSQALWNNDQHLGRFLKQLPLPRIGVPEDIMGLALFLAGDAAAYCTGGTYTADGGYTI